MADVMSGVLVLCGLSGSLAILLLLAEAVFANYGECEITINDGDRLYKVQGGSSLLQSLAEQKLFLPSGCGGRGSCGTCKCRVLDGAGPYLPTETPYLTDDEMAAKVRLSCQIKVKQNLVLTIPAELLAVKDYMARVAGITDLTGDIKGLRLVLPNDETVSFKAGQFVNLVVPPYGEISEPTSRAYSIASPPHENKGIELVIRLVPNGMATTYVFEHLKEEDNIQIIGPYGEFFLRDTDREIVFIAGGSGLAPIRSIVLDMIARNITHRKATLFFGAVRLQDLYFVEDFTRIQEEHPWFRFVPGLSGKDENHSYEKGLITDITGRFYETLDNHEGYLCGSPGMIDACIKVLSSKGMPDNLIYFDKF